MDLRKTQTYISLQILYTFLAVILMVYHSTQHYQNSGTSLFWDFFLFGEIGEDLLFILMGFTIFYTSYHFIEKQSGYKEYMIKTLSRIFLIYWMLIAIPGLILWFINPDFHHSIAKIKADELWQMVFMWFGHPRIAVITWVLTHLVFFAIIFGLAIISKKFKILWYIILFISTINLIDRVFIGSEIFGHHRSTLYLIFSPHNLEFAFGAFAYYFFKKGYTIKHYKLFLLFALILFFTIGAIHTYTELDFYHERVVTFGIVSLILVIAVVNYGRFVPPPANNIFYKLGEAEYIMLMIHGPMLSIINFRYAVHSEFGWIITLVTIFIILVISYFIRVKIEKPALAFINKKTLGYED